MNRDTIIQPLKRSEMAHSEEAAKCVPKEVKFDKGLVPAKDLVKIYVGRAEQLKLRQGKYASQLLDDTRSLIKSLRQHENKSVMIISTDKLNDFRYLIFISNPKVLLGCLKIVSKLDVSPEHWNQLWSNNQNEKG